MNAKTVGRFLRIEREKNNLSRKQLAVRLGVPTKTLLFWEKGLQMPPLKHLENLSNLLGVSVGELLAGKRIVHRTPEITDRIILEAMEFAGERAEGRIDQVLLGLGALFLLFPLCFIREGKFILYHLVGLGLIMSAVARICRRHKAQDVTEKEFRMYIYALLCQTAALALEILPYGAALLFSMRGKEDLQKTFSYFKQAATQNLFYTLTGVLSVLQILLLSTCFTRRQRIAKLRKVILICAVLTLIFSISPYIINGILEFNATNICISGLVLASLALQVAAMRHSG